MVKFLYWIVEVIAHFHTYFLNLNDSYELYFTDKQLHFLIIGAIGLLAVLAMYPLIRFLASHKHYLSICFIFAFCFIICLTFAIEIGQKLTNTGSMEFADILYGVWGFIDFYIGLVVIVFVVKQIIRFFKFLFFRRKK